MDIRQQKGLTQRMFLSHIHVHDRNNVECHILSSSAKTYKVIMYDYRTNFKISCSCPDFVYKRTVCKHMYWLGTKKIGTALPNEWSPEMIDTFVSKTYFPYLTTSFGRNEECPICLEQLDYENDDTICCVTGCSNAVHATCWNKYYYYSMTNKCVVCRTRSMPMLFPYYVYPMF
jgi:hypothetical protein